MRWKKIGTFASVCTIAFFQKARVQDKSAATSLPSEIRITFDESFQYIEVVIKAFLEMSEVDQESYLNLHNKFDADETTWSVGMAQQFTAILHSTNQMKFLNISREKAFKVLLDRVKREMLSLPLRIVFQTKQGHRQTNNV